MLSRNLLVAPLAVVGLIFGTSEALSQGGNLEKLGQFKTTGVKDFTVIEQGGDKAAAIRKTLERIKMPPGFKIDLYAIVPDARHMAVSPQGIVTFVGTRKTEVWAVTDRDKNRVADEVKNFVPSLEKDIPNGPCFTPDGVLYVVERNRVVQYPAASFFYEGPDVPAFAVVPQGELIPPEEESYNHSARVCDIGPDGKLYISLGQPYNVPPKDKMDLYDEWGIGGIIRMNLDGSGREVYASGIRNSVGIEFNPADGNLWFTDNQVDGMGDNTPPGEINRATEKDQHFGFPWYGGGSVRTEPYKDSEPPEDVIFPQVETFPHAADLGMMFYTGDQFPAKYRGGIFNAQHGSWNRTTPVGARVIFTPINEDGTAGEHEVFAEGWLNEETGEYLGRPVDVVQLPDGSILVSDDLVGAIYRISHE